jgi:hypothetical protein
MTNIVGQINFWVSGDTFPNFTQLLCDCIFVIEKKCIWKNKNKIELSDLIVDNKQSFEHHYQWVNHGEHKFLKKKRYTLKADKNKSFQPQNSEKNLIDILPFLNENGITTNKLISSMVYNRGSRPFKINEIIGYKLYHYLYSSASIKLFGYQLKNIHP